MFQSPGDHHGAEYCFKDLLIETAEAEVCKHNHNSLIHILQIVAYPGFYTNNKYIFVRISLDGARFTRQSTYYILSFAVLSGRENISSEGKR